MPRRRISGVDSNPRCREGFQGRNSARVWRAIRSDKKHPCSRDFVRLGFGSVSALSGSLRSPRLNADHGELLMLGIEVAQSTVGRYMVRRRQPPSRVGRLSCPITRPRHTARDALAAGTSGLVGAVERRVAKL